MLAEQTALRMRSFQKHNKPQGLKKVVQQATLYTFYYNPPSPISSPPLFYIRSVDRLRCKPLSLSCSLSPSLPSLYTATERRTRSSIL